MNLRLSKLTFAVAALVFERVVGQGATLPKPPSNAVNDVTSTELREHLRSSRRTNSAGRYTLSPSFPIAARYLGCAPAGLGIQTRR